MIKPLNQIREYKLGKVHAFFSIVEIVVIVLFVVVIAGGVWLTWTPMG